MAVDEFQRGLGIEASAGHDRGRHERGEDELRVAPRVEHRGSDDGDFLGAPGDSVQDPLELAAPPPDVDLAPFGVPVVPEVSNTTLLLRSVDAGR